MGDLRDNLVKLKLAFTVLMPLLFSKIRESYLKDI